MATEEQSKIKLYWLEKSRAQNILWLLEELKLPYELETFHRVNMLAPPELKKIHPLGKSPVISITPPGSTEPIVLAESGFIVQYLSEHFGQGTTMMPKRWKEGQEGKIGGETEQWMRWQYLLHYVEGSLMSMLIMAMVLGALKSPQVPFFIRPITSLVVNQLFSRLVLPNAKAQLGFLEQQETSGGDYLCGSDLTSADVLISFALMAAKDKFETFGTWEAGGPKKLFPKLFAYIDRLEAHPGYKNSVQKVKEIDSSLGIQFP
ncbi:glutathione S-transferase [Annulohypoxylon maeteangense]|uniref:glutathione S-transferase n=1 Tax=Annulohypoxylon maeteangense TaxID=1927788 RepID=UPI002007EE5F|nr:glutathione S-transferase [Annulohypoxylon maeteangense]KAI0881934.1 glutathione S-transferase [Annulohypoxylon maeteangense]